MNDLAKGITEYEVKVALELLAACVPQAHVTPGAVMASVWHCHLSTFPAEAVNAVARTWPGERFPSAGEFARAVRRSMVTEEAPWL